MQAVTQLRRARIDRGLGGVYIQIWRAALVTPRTVITYIYIYIGRGKIGTVHVYSFEFPEMNKEENIHPVENCTVNFLFSLFIHTECEKQKKKIKTNNDFHSEIYKYK